MKARCWLLTLSALGILAPGTSAQDTPGRPVALQVQPETIVLTGPRARQQLIVTGKYADGSLRDLTRECQVRLEGEAARVAGSVLIPRQDGSATLVVQAQGVQARAPVRVERFTEPQPISFAQEVIAAFNVSGCNMGACHGTPSGKGGFRLSLRGYDPATDYFMLTRDALARRTSSLAPGNSLILQKALGRLPHEGGQRLAPGSVPHQILEGWIAQGRRDDPESLPTLTGIEVLPGSRVLRAPSARQQLVVLGRFSDGAVRDVTHLTVFSSSDETVATVSQEGLVRFSRGGEVAILSRYLETMEAVRLVYLEPREGFVWSNPPEHNYIDHHVFNKLRLLSIQPSELCSDEELLRRAYLDLCAILPTPEEAGKFLADKDPRKREKLIDQLLSRPEYADFWTLKWMDVLRGTRKTLQLQGVQAYRGWIREQIEKNVPLDRTVHAMLTATGTSWETGPANYYCVTKDPTELAEATAQVFLGVRMQCAKCHNHPFERWTQDDYYSLSAFFARVSLKTASGKKLDPKKPESLVVAVETKGDVTNPRTGDKAPLAFPGGEEATMTETADRRAVLASWLTAPENPFFARAAVNRIWYHLMGRGIVDPVDDFRDSNPSANDELLDALAEDFVKSGHNVKQLIRTIMTSRTYQLSGRSNPFNEDDERYFSRARIKLLTAEQLLDALSTVTEVPEKFSGVPAGTRAVQLPDGEINHLFLKTFGQPARELPCECERGEDSSLAQAMQLINGKTLHDKLIHPGNRLGRLLGDKTKAPEAILEEVYLAALSRLPRANEKQAALAYVASAEDSRKGWEDVLWAILNTKEFMFRH